MSKKTLFIMRHAKAEGQTGGKSDFARPMMELGEKRTIIVANELIRRRTLPQYIITSPATRALQTAKCLAEAIDLDKNKIVTQADLYFKTVNDYFDALYAAPDEYQSVMIVGHNPLVTQFANFFLSVPLDEMPTSSVVGLQSDAHTWPEFVIAYKKALFYLMPKNIENEK